MSENQVWVFLKALGKHWITLLTGGLLMAIVTGLDLGGVGIQPSLKLAILLVTLLVAAFQTWQQEYAERFRLREKLTAYPRLVIASVDAATMWGSFKGGVFTDKGPDNSVIWLRLRNDPLVNTPDSVAEQVSALVKFYDAQGQRLFEMEGRWSHTTQPPQRAAGADKTEFLAVQFPIGVVRSLDIAFKLKARGPCYGFNDESYSYDDFANPAFTLPTGTIIAVVEISGVRVKHRVRIQFDNPVGPGELSVLNYETEDLF